MKDHLNQSGDLNYLYRFGSAEFDQSRLELRINGQTIDAERRPLELLSLFLEHVGEVLTKDELFHSLWDSEEVGEGALANALSRLRRILGPDNSGYIVTRPRLGYSFVGKVERIALNQPLKSTVDLEANKPIAGRQDFLLDTLLSVAGNSSREVWLARPVRKGTHHVFKFTADADGLRQLKREYTISQLLSQAPSTTDSVAAIVGRNFETPPFYLEYPYLGPDLLKWAETNQQLLTLNRDERLALFLQIADTVSAAHSMGVLHKDLKPSNILMTNSSKELRPVLTDFGSSHLMQSKVLNDMGISPLGLSMTFDSAPSNQGTTLMYLAPEVWTGESPSIQSDVYALGIMLYQMLSGDLNQGIPPDWQTEIGDDLLNEDIRLATATNPAQRLQSVTELTERLRNLPARRQEAVEQSEREAYAAAMQAALDQSRARRPWLVAAILSLMVGMIASLGLYQEAVRAQKSALASKQETLKQMSRTQNINQFWQDEIIQSGNPYQRDQASVPDVLAYASQRVSQIFADDPETAATTHESLANAFNGLNDFARTRENYLAAADKYAEAYGPNSIPEWRTRLMLSQIMARKGEIKEAEQILQDFRAQPVGSSFSRSLLGFYALKASSQIHSAQQNWSESARDLERAVALIPLLDSLPEEDRQTTYLGLAGKYRRLQRYDEAEALLTNILNSDTALSSARVASLRLRKAMIYLDQKQINLAEPLLLELKDELSLLLGENSLDHLRALNQLSTVYRVKKDYVAAVQYARQAYEISSAYLGPDHANTLIDQSQLGYVLHLAGDNQEAIPIMQDAIVRFTAMYSPEPGYVHMLRYLVAEALIQEQEYNKARDLLSKIDTTTLETTSPGFGAENRLAILNTVVNTDTMVIGARRDLMLDKLNQLENCDPCVVYDIAMSHLEGHVATHTQALTDSE